MIISLAVKGKGGHAALPHEAVDPIVIAASITTALQTLISRETSPFSPAVITITRIEAGTAFNIIPEEVVMKGAMRFFTPEHGEYLQGRVTEVAKGIATTMGGSCTMELPLGVPPFANDPMMTQLVHRAAALIALAGGPAAARAGSACGVGVDRLSATPQLRRLLLPSQATACPVAGTALVKSRCNTSTHTPYTYDIVTTM